MALNAISNLAPALVPIVVKLIDNFFSTDGTVTPPEIRANRERYTCCCETRATNKSTRSDVNQCNSCGRPYSTIDISNKQYLNIAKNKTRSLSSSDSYGNNNRVEKKGTRRGRSLSDGYPKRVTDDDTLVELGRLVEKEAVRINDAKYKLQSSNRRDVRKSLKKPEVFRSSASSSSKRF